MTRSGAALRALADEARACTLCTGELPHAPRPVFSVSTPAPILLIGQAPGRRVHETGIPWNDRSGDRLRDWLGVSRVDFYDPSRFAILPMGLCYPGTDRGKGDRPPMPRCAPTWHPRFEALLKTRLRLKLLVGAYALAFHFPASAGRSLSDVVRASTGDLGGTLFALPHPSPRNQRWIHDRPWFESDVIPRLRARVTAALKAAPSADHRTARSTRT